MIDNDNITIPPEAVEAADTYDAFRAYCLGLTFGLFTGFVLAMAVMT